MQMIVVSTKMMDYTTLMKLIVYSVSVSGSLNSVLPCLLIILITEILLQLLDGSKALLKEKNDILPIVFKQAIQKGKEHLILWMCS